MHKRSATDAIFDPGAGALIYNKQYRKLECDAQCTWRCLFNSFIKTLSKECPDQADPSLPQDRHVGSKSRLTFYSRGSLFSFGDLVLGTNVNLDQVLGLELWWVPALFAAYVP